MYKSICFKLYSFFQFYINNIFLSKYDIKLLRLINNNKVKSTKIFKVGLEMPEDYFYAISFIFLLNSFKNLYNLEIGWIKINTQYQKRGRVSILKYLFCYNRKWHKLYLGNGGKIKLDYDISLFNYIRYYFEAKAVFDSLNSKDDLINFKYKNVAIGELIYDTYLRYKPAPTVDVTDKFLHRILISTLFIFNSSYNYLLKEKPNLIFTSYTSYVHHGILTKLALQNNILVYSLGSYELLFNNIKSDFPFHIKDYRNYKTDFLKLEYSIQNDLILEAKTLLEQRFAGINDSATFYMKNNAYRSNVIPLFKAFANSTKPRVVIFVHDFYDSPHVRRWMLFADFYEWLIFTLKSADTDNFDYFVKIHPNSTLDTISIVSKLVNDNNSKIVLLSTQITTKDLLNEGFSFGVTNHGTIAHELPYFGIPVVNSGDNPHVGYKFSYTVKSLGEYFNIVHNPSILYNLLSIDDARKEIYSFYAMHNLVLSNVDNITVSENQFINNQVRFIDSPRKLMDFVVKLNDSEFVRSIESPFMKFVSSINL